MPELLPMAAAAEEAYTVVEGEYDLSYRVYADHAELCRSYTFRDSLLAEELVIPSEVDGRPVTVVLDLSSYPMRAITLPDTVTSIGRDAFWNCDQLEEITIPSGVTEIPTDAFHGCKALRKVTLPSGITKIGSGAFRYCEALTSFTFPEGIEEISSYSFECCTSLSEISDSGQCKADRKRCV